MAGVDDTQTPDKKPRKPRTKPEGVEIKFRVPENVFNKLKAAGEADFRTPENLAYVATMKHAAEITSAGTHK